MSRCAIISFRLGLSDGVSVVAQRWLEMLTRLGFEVVTVAGEGPVDRRVAGLGIGDAPGPQTVETMAAEFEAAVGDCDLVVVENLCTIPLNLTASRVVADALTGRPAVLHHHDPPWQRERFAHVTELPPHDDAWRHVTINRLTAEQFAERGIPATCIYNAFDVNAPTGDRQAVRSWLGVDDETLLVCHPVRAIARKNIPAAIAIAEDLGGTYWLLGEAEEGYGPELSRLLAAAGCPVLHRSAPRIPDIYAAADLVVFPSLWEGFGNPPVEAAINRRPCVVGDYPVADEIRRLGFKWFSPEDLSTVQSFLAHPDAAVLERNRAVAVEHFSLERIGAELAGLLGAAGWLP